MNDHGESTTTRKPADQRDRAAALRQRRLANGIKSVRALHEQSGVSRDAITTAEAGRASEATYQRLEAWFARYELANTAQDVALAQIEYEVHSGDGLRITVRGLLADAEQLERAVTRLIRELRQPG